MTTAADMSPALLAERVDAVIFADVPGASVTEDGRTVP